MVNETLKWINGIGGIESMAGINERKAARLYEARSIVMTYSDHLFLNHLWVDLGLPSITPCRKDALIEAMREYR